MERRYYHKLIRDSVPDVMDAKGVVYEIGYLDDADFLRELLRKATEEAQELTAAKDRAEAVREMGDVLDVLDAIRTQYGIGDEELLASREEQWKKKGGFVKRVFLFWTEG